MKNQVWIERLTLLDGEKRKPFNSNSFDSEYQRDRARIIHSAAFRRLQSKTQVLGLGDHDFYRTRLTHSLEVMQLGSGIAETLKFKYDRRNKFYEWIPDKYLIESICLAHDIGHPPFGHGGERALNYKMHEYGGFEGNAQTLRIVSKLAEFSKEKGLDFTRRTLLGLIKYPATFSQVNNSDSYLNADINNNIKLDSWKPPKCIYDEESEIFNWIIKPFSNTDQFTFNKFKVLDKKHHKTKFKSFDCSIMNLADDISYGVHDLEDAIALRLITKEKWNSEVISKINKSKFRSDLLDLIKKLHTRKLFSESSKERKHIISRMINYLIASVTIKSINEFDHPLLRYNVSLTDQAQFFLDLLQSIVVENVIRAPEVLVLEYKGQQMIIKIFEVIENNPDKILPLATQKKFNSKKNEKWRKRIICDYISGMTDLYATKLYHKIFSPSIGSIFDRL